MWKLLGVTLFWPAVGMLGCSGPSASDDAHTDSATDTQQVPARNYDFVVRTLTIDDRYDVGVAHTGLNIDGLFSGPADADGCNHEDFFSRYDSDQHRPPGCAPMAHGGALLNSPSCAGGVDNQWLQIFNELQTGRPNVNMRTELLERIFGGQLTYLIRISEVNDVTTDPMVRVRVWEGYPQFVDCRSMFSGGAEFSVATSTLGPNGSNIDADALFNQPGRIEAGRLVVSHGAGAASIRLPVPAVLGGVFLPSPNGFALRDVRIRLTLSADGVTASDGVIAGWFVGENLIPLCICDDFHTYVNALLARIVDIRLPGSTVCVDRSIPENPQFGGVSAGVGFTAVRAIIRSQPAGARVPGMCGSEATDHDGGE